MESNHGWFPQVKIFNYECVAYFYSMAYFYKSVSSDNGMKKTEFTDFFKISNLTAHNFFMDRHFICLPTFFLYVHHSIIEYYPKYFHANYIYLAYWSILLVKVFLCITTIKCITVKYCIMLYREKNYELKMLSGTVSISSYFTRL